MNYLYIIALVLVFPIVYSQVRKVYYLTLNRNFLKNRNVQDKVEPLVTMALQKYGFIDYKPSEYTQIKFFQLDKETDMIIVEVFILNKNEFIKWNAIERLVLIKGYKVGDKFFVKSLEDSNSQDLGAIIPNVSNIPLNTLFRSRRWDRQKEQHLMNKKDWSIKWMDKAII